MPGLLRGVARTAAIAGTATAVSGGVQRRQNARWAAKDQGQQAAAPEPVAAAPAAPAAPAVDPIAQLNELGELHASGVLTDEEFAVQKSKILNA